MNSSKLKLIVAMIIFGSIGLVVRGIDLPSSQIALTRGIIGSLFLLSLSLISKKKFSLEALRPNLVLLISSGAAIGFNWILLFEAYKYTSISNATLSYYFAPVLVMFVSPFFLKERLAFTKVLSIFGAVAGMLLIVRVGEGSGTNHLLGIGYGLLAAILYASVIVMNKFLTGLSGLETTIVQISTASTVLLPYVLFTSKAELSALNAKTLILLLFLGIVSTGMAYYLYFSAIKKLSGQTIAIFSYIDPIFAIIMSGILLREQLTFLQILGGVLILGATFLSETQSKN